jgi:hypothetical protein
VPVRPCGWEVCEIRDYNRYETMKLSDLYQIRRSKASLLGSKPGHGQIRVTTA